MKCPWLKPASQDNALICQDGTLCSVHLDGSAGWSCCKNHGGRAICPKKYPTMCARPNCAAGGKDYCCLTDCTFYGGERQCGKLKLY